MKLSIHSNTNSISLLVLTALACLHSPLHGQSTARSSPHFLRHPDASSKSGPARNIFVAPDTDHIFPYILSSPTWTTTFYLTNLEDREIQVSCEFVAPNGESKPFRFSFAPNDEPTGFTESRIAKFATESFSIVAPRPVEGTAAPLSTAWAYCASEPRTDRFSGYAIVRNTATNGASREFLTTLQPESEPVFSVPLTDTATNTTGLVLLNNDLEVDANLALWLFDRDGNTIANTTLTLKPSNLQVIVLNDAFPDAKSGTVRVVSADGTKYLTGLALRTNAAGYTALFPLTPK
jgi:hypothetical protein